MNRFLFSGLAGCLTLSCTASGAVQTEEISSPFADESAKSENADIYYASQEEADAALDAFDKANPSCQMWTNWQKMCSRTGNGGSTLCNIDVRSKARPSTPFCEVRLITELGKSENKLTVWIGDPYLDIKENLSRNRFCQIISDTEDFDDSDHKTSGEKCSKFLSSRPFNGLYVQAIENPRCKKWIKLNTGIYYCDEPVADHHCPIPTNIVRPPKVNVDDNITLGETQSGDIAVFGLYCNP